MSDLVGICVGHSRKIKGRIEGGAVSVGGISEHAFNCGLARAIQSILKSHRVKAVVISEYEGGSYGSAQRWLAGQLKDAGVSVAMELHFNASDNPDAAGHEWLYWATSQNGRRLAESLSDEMGMALPQLKSRGIKAKTAADRGAQFLSGTHCPAVICEPFFGSNPADWNFASQHQEAIARAIAWGLLDYYD